MKTYIWTTIGFALLGCVYEFVTIMMFTFIGLAGDTGSSPFEHLNVFFKTITIIIIAPAGFAYNLAHENLMLGIVYTAILFGIIGFIFGKIFDIKVEKGIQKSQEMNP
jgi:hypothetical protein